MSLSQVEYDNCFNGFAIWFCKGHLCISRMKKERAVDIMYTKHASERMVQRGIPYLIVEWLLEYGTVAASTGGGSIRFFDKKCRKNIMSNIGKEAYKRLKDLMNCYLVECNGIVITVGKRNKKIRR